MNEVAKKQPEQDMLPADPMVSMIERIAMDPNSDLSKLEKMLEMKERHEARQARQAFDQAIAEAKAQIKPIVRTGSVDYGEGARRTHFKHETLDGIAASVDPILSEHGLSYRYRSEQRDGMVHVTCILAHRAGHSEETTLSGSPDSSGSKNNYQAIGSAVTYLQRYTIKLALGLSAAKDDDGNAGGGSAPVINAEQFQTLKEMMEKAQADEGKMLAFLKAEDLHELTIKQFDTAVSMLRKKIQKNAEGADA